MSEPVVLDGADGAKDTPDNGSAVAAQEAAASVSAPHRERFIPVTRFALLSRLSGDGIWQAQEQEAAERFLTYLGQWRHHVYSERLLELKEAYLPFSPDRDTVQVLKYSPEEMDALRERLTKSLTDLLIQANYERITEETINDYFAAKSPYGLNLKVDLTDFDDVLVFFRGAKTSRQEFRTWKTGFLGKESFDVPIFQRLFLLIKLKPETDRIREIMSERQVDEAKARRILERIRKNIPDGVSSDHVYLKLFKSINQSDMEMLFPNTKVEFKLFDKIKFAVTAGGGTASAIVGSATKLLAATNPITLTIAIAGLAAVLFRQIMSFFNQRTKYMMVLAQNLYFHNLANNRGVLTLLVDRAEEEDIKEEMLLYTYLIQREMHRTHLAAAQREIEDFLQNDFGVAVAFDIEDALSRLIADGIVTQMADGWLRPMRPHNACHHLEALWRDSLGGSAHRLRARTQELAS